MNELCKKIIDIVNANLEGPGLTPESSEQDLTSFGLDSIIFINIIVALEEAFNIEIPDEKLLITEMNTISKMEDVISAVLKRRYQDNIIGE